MQEDLKCYATVNCFEKEQLVKLLDITNSQYLNLLHLMTDFVLPKTINLTLK